MSYKPRALLHAVDKIRAHLHLPEVKEFADQIMNGDRSALAMAFSLLESSKLEHFQYGLQLLSLYKSRNNNSFRIGITGVPGVGKSTLIESLGLHYLNEGHRVAVLAVDPSSPLSGGSILGDKTRMQQLSMHMNAFIRPTAAAKALGGVASDTKLAIQLCEMAGYDRIIIETVGVGQSEVAVHGMTDMFVLLMLAGAGDQLQGIKRGIVELCDAMVITKSDGDNIAAAQRAKAEYTGALHLLAPKSNGWTPEIVTASSISPMGINEVTNLFSRFMKFVTERGLKESNRLRQDTIWLKNELMEIAFKQWMTELHPISHEEIIGKALNDGESITQVLLNMISKR
jgi:LAO/AO transport system kinase